MICDSPAGIEKGAIAAMRFADQAIVVTNPEISSVRDSDRMMAYLLPNQNVLRKAESPSRSTAGTRYQPERVQTGEMLGTIFLRYCLSIFWGLSESKAVLKSSNMGVPVTHNKQSDAGQAYLDAVDRLLGETKKPMRFIESARKGFFASILGVIAGSTA